MGVHSEHRRHKSIPAYGEKLLNRLLRDLPKKQFFCHYEPQIVTPDGSSKPDFVIVSALLGVVVLEVKDWVKLQGGSQQIRIDYRGGVSGFKVIIPGM